MHALPDPEIGSVTVLGVDDFAIARERTYATVLIDAVTHRRIDLLPDRKSSTLAAWLREHPGVEVVSRDGSAAYAEAIRQAAPQAVQASDRWYLWHNLACAMKKTVVAHSACWNTTPSPERSALTSRTREVSAVHDLLAVGVGLLECARRLGAEHGQTLRPRRARRRSAAPAALRRLSGRRTP
ncbi:transposase [Lentzea sp. NPDC006480]|uniref:transposase n=1 Tax=Lentzea sp. NPDC006480 TaxID=3157176 RepID=UPI00339ED43F